MELTYRRAEEADAGLLVELYDRSFYEDFVKYGQCPAYGRTKERMEESIRRFPKEIVLCDGVPVGAISWEHRGGGQYYLGCLCVAPDYQNRGIGTQAVSYFRQTHPDWTRIELITPADKIGNIHFYTQKCGFELINTAMDGDVKVVCLSLKRADDRAANH